MWDMYSAVFTISVLMGMGVDKLCIYVYPTSGPSQNQAVNSTLLCDLHTKWGN